MNLFSEKVLKRMFLFFMGLLSVCLVILVGITMYYSLVGGLIFLGFLALFVGGIIGGILIDIS